jgi:hypothetical protein
MASFSSLFRSFASCLSLFFSNASPLYDTFTRQVSPEPVDFVLDTDYAGLRYGGNGAYDFTAPVVMANNEG